MPAYFTLFLLPCNTSNNYLTPDEFAEQLKHHLKNVIVRLLDKQSPSTLVEDTAPLLEEILQENEETLLLHQLRLAVRLWEENQRSEDYLWKSVV